LINLLGEVGSILCNPIDVSQAQFHGLTTLFHAIDSVAEDPVIDLILIQEDVDILLSVYPQEWVEQLNEFFIGLKSRQNKPLVIVSPPGSAEPERSDIEQRLLKASIPVFPTMERAARAIVTINKYFSPR